MFLGSDNVAVLLVREGLAKVDEYAAGSRELTEAQDEAKSLKKNVSYVSVFLISHAHFSSCWFDLLIALEKLRRRGGRCCFWQSG